MTKHELFDALLGVPTGDLSRDEVLDAYARAMFVAAGLSYHHRLLPDLLGRLNEQRLREWGEVPAIPHVPNGGVPADRR